MKALNPIVIAGQEVLPLIEGGKGVAISNGMSSGAWAAAGGVGTFSGVNADSYDASGNFIPQIYHGRTRRDRHEELLKYAIDGGITATTANGLSYVLFGAYDTVTYAGSLFALVDRGTSGAMQWVFPDPQTAGNLRLGAAYGTPVVSSLRYPLGSTH